MLLSEGLVFTLLQTGKALSADTFCFQCVEKAFRTGVIVTVARAEPQCNFSPQALMTQAGYYRFHIVLQALHTQFLCQTRITQMDSQILSLYATGNRSHVQGDVRR